MQSVLLVSNSDSIKFHATTEVFPSDKFKVTWVEIPSHEDGSHTLLAYVKDTLNLVSWAEREQYLKDRLDYAKKLHQDDDFDYHVSIWDCLLHRYTCDILIEHKGVQVSSTKTCHYNGNEFQVLTCLDIIVLELKATLSKLISVPVKNIITQMQSVLLVSTDSNELKAVATVFPPDKFTITCVESPYPSEKIWSQEKRAKFELNQAQKSLQQYDYYIVIKDIALKCVILLEHKGILVISDKMIFSDMTKMISNLEDSVATALFPNVASVTTATIVVNLKDALLQLDEKRKIVVDLISKYKSYSDYPKPGVTFQDFFAVIREADDISRLFNLMAEQYRYDEIEYVCGPESRGFFGFGLCTKLHVGFIPLRKKGKLPGKVASITYNLEYGTDTLEAPEDIKLGSRVLVFDDLIATGGSSKAACDLLEQAGCIIIGCIVLREVPALRSKASSTLGRPYKVLLQD